MKAVERLSGGANGHQSVSQCQDQPLSMNQMVACNQEVHQKYCNILCPLSLLFHSSLDAEENPDMFQEEWSESSVSEATPTSLADLCEQLLHRIKEQSALLSTTVEDQQALVVVMTSELGRIWCEVNGFITDPTLTQEENKQLYSQTIGEVLRICEQLYLNYLHLLHTLRRRAVFTDQANRSRLGAQMAMDCTNILNVYSIRRNIAAGIKATRTARSRSSDDCSLKGVPKTNGHLSPQANSGCKNQILLDRDIREITEKMGDLDLEWVYELMPYNLEVISRKVEDLSVKSPVTSETNVEPDEDGNIYYRYYTRLKGCSSMPDLQRETLLEELEMEALPARSQSPLVLIDSGPSCSSDKPFNPKDDLRRLYQHSLVDETATDPEADLPPLIKALPWSCSAKLQMLQKTLQRLKRSRAPQQKPPPPQTTVVDVAHPQNQGALALTATARVSHRVLPETINIQMYPPVYNDLTGELKLCSVRWMDCNLFAGEEIKEVYRELSKSISTQYLNFDEDPMIEHFLANTKYSPKRKNQERFINPELKMQTTQCMSQRKRCDGPVDHKKPTDINSRAYNAWLQWWKTNLTLEDYLQYISKQDSDYLGVVFHLYDSDDADDEEDEKRRLLQLQQKEVERRRREKIEALKRTKQEYVAGVWNVNAVMLGGLWKEPVMEDEEVSLDEETSHNPKQGSQKGHKPAARTGTNGDRPTDSEEQLQRRLERIWAAVSLPNAQRLDMAIKYSSHNHRNRLEEATAAWECVARLIQQRESLLARLELFEREASDPNRFFQPGYKGASVARMEESKHRDKLHGQLTSLEKLLSKTIHHISDCFNDTVSYKGRPYCEKMRWDRIEMLYWLQQEKRVCTLDRVVEGRVSVPARLPPLGPILQLNSGTHPTPMGHTPTSSQSTHLAPLTDPNELRVTCIRLNTVNK
ncbi:coiled-coil domain-containing protein 87 [Osmerus mordax]|uniref:coiled-coil domain-containing protein 87 n=1 Tax=Osmerus mordax TaxID=8014 RepID=UPI00350F8505